MAVVNNQLLRCCLWMQEVLLIQLKMVNIPVLALMNEQPLWVDLTVDSGIIGARHQHCLDATIK